MQRRLPDYIKPGVRLLFVGINPGMRSAALGHHFAGYSNRFWKLLSESGMVPVPLTHADDWRLPEWELGLTNLVARSSPGIDTLTARDYMAGRAKLLAKIRRYRPDVIAVLGVTLCPFLLLPGPTRGTSPAAAPVRRKLGWQRETLAGARVFLLPNPSGRNAHYSYRDMLRAYRRLHAHLAGREPARKPRSKRRPLAPPRDNH